VFTARYALSPYIKQIRFVFKGLNFDYGWTGLPNRKRTPMPLDRILLACLDKEAKREFSIPAAGQTVIFQCPVLQPVACSVHYSIFTDIPSITLKGQYSQTGF
jgi:hypothetical protein